MNFKMLGTLGKIAGLAGLALGLLVFVTQGIVQLSLRSLINIGPAESYALLRSFVILSVGITGIGVVTWLMSLSAAPRERMPMPFVSALSILFIMVLGASVYIGSLPTITQVQVPPKQQSNIITNKIRNYIVCVGEHASSCPPNSVVLNCGSSVESWVKAQCPSSTITRLSDLPGNRCGYYTVFVSCDQP
ncbi:MAG TPA: hypothetical protein VHY35_02310 [Stellaceae bacterium]|jgi:hypothetical protein|nr:hypothetical protein [Stellaceae bacterium]